ncbi:MAG TPA: SurA N-terminal domain-containing protein [Xanthobacteraceae bacterium]|nr:SurA N-terminal domain-containing protein [Xanthobacteraceae bacterium]
MLRGIRKASSNWVGKSILSVVVAFLVVSFAVWGIGDIFRGFGQSTVAKIGGTEVTIEQFRQIYNDRLQQISRQVGRPITPDQANALGIDRQILSQYISENLLDEQSRRMGLGITDEEIARTIHNDPTFWGINGQFDKARFDALIRQAGYTEGRFLGEQRRQIVRRQLAMTLGGDLPVTTTLLEAFNRFTGERRAAEFLHLTAADAGDIAAPSEDALKAYFEERRSSFRAPEYRKLAIVSLLPGEQAQWIQISDADARKAYDERRAQFVTPERRHLQQMVFPNAEQAQAAAEQLKGGLGFADLAKERGLSEKDIDLGTVAKSAMVDSAIAEAAFAAAPDTVAGPVQGRFGHALVRVLKVEPEQVQTFEQVAPELKKQLALGQARGAMAETYNKLEDERAGGATLTEAAERLKLSIRTVEAVDRSGRGPDGEPVANLPDAQRIVSSAFNADIGVENDPLQFDGGYIWYDVLDVTPARDRDFAEAKPQIEARWREDEIASRLKAKAAEALDKLKAGASMADVASAMGKTVETASGLQRGQPSGVLSASTVDGVFRLPENGFDVAQGSSPSDQFVLRVSGITVPPFDAKSETAAQTRQVLDNAVADSVITQYVGKLQSDLGVTINQTALRQATGLSAPTTN